MQTAQLQTLRNLAAQRRAELQVQFDLAREVLGNSHPNVSRLKAHLDDVSEALDALRAEPAQEAA